MSVYVDDTLVLAEVFGPTLQGEGPSAGRTASFIRTGGCNLICRWCDTPYTWDGVRYNLRQELTRTPVVDVLAQVERHGAELAVITGGEPLLHQQQEGWRTLLDGLARMGRRVEVETNGTIPPDAFTATCVDAFNVSPKLAHAGMPDERRIRPDVLSRFLATGKAVFKWVCRTADDVDTVAYLTADLGIPSHLVWIMPEGVSREALANVTGNIIDRVMQYRFNWTSRMHVMLWGNERGR